jgi:hypothetical protein
VITADFNQDGRLDLAVTNYYANTVSILLGKGDGTFRQHRDFGTGPNDSDIVAADFDGDGRIDLAVCNESGNSLSILLGNGDGTFQGHVDYATAANPRVMAQADLNADGILDLVTQNGASETISVLLGNGDGTFQAHTDSSDQNAELGVAAADFNDDGRLDIAGANGDGTVSIFLQHTLNGGDTCLPPPSGLVSWWSGDKTAEDVQGTNPGVLKNGASFRPGKVGPGFVFDGIDDAVVIPNSASLSQTRITLDAWVYPTGAQGTIRHIISKDEDTVAREYVLGIYGDNRFNGFVQLPSGEAVVFGTTTAQLNTWYHVAMTHDGLKLRLYVNGVLEGALDAVGDVVPTSNPLGIGGNIRGAFFQGIIDEAQIFNRALTDAEILAIYQAGADGQCKPDIFVASIDPSYTVSGHGFRISTSVLIQDVNGVGINGATVQLGVILPSGSALTFPLTTDATGQADVSFTVADSGLYQFKVRNVTHPIREYDASLNIETSDTLLIP